MSFVMQRYGSVRAFTNAGNPYQQFRGSRVTRNLLESTIAATDADFGNVQLLDSSCHALNIVAQHGFESEFLDYFAVVRFGGASACGSALKNQCRVVVPDIAASPIFSSTTKEILRRANTRSVQSTPLIDRHGRCVGIVSTHYRHENAPTLEMWKRVDKIVANFVSELESSNFKKWEQVASTLRKEASTSQMSLLLQQLKELS